MNIGKHFKHWKRLPEFLDKTINTFAARLFVKIAGLFCGRMNFNECWGGFLKRVRLTSFQIIILVFMPDTFRYATADAADFTGKRKRDVF